LAGDLRTFLVEEAERFDREIANELAQLLPNPARIARLRHYLGDAKQDLSLRHQRPHHASGRAGLSSIFNQAPTERKE
jgi:hypothetical protein